MDRNRFKAPEIDKTEGQARKSLWIETISISIVLFLSPVRLVRACGSKLDIDMGGVFEVLVRLVRACGSKL